MLSAGDGSWRAPPWVTSGHPGCTCWQLKDTTPWLPLPSYLHVMAAQEHLPWPPLAPQTPLPRGWPWRSQAHSADPRSLGTYGGRGESPLAGSSFSINRARRTRLVWGSQSLDSRVWADGSYLSSLSHSSSPAFHLRLPSYGSLRTSRTENYILAKSNLKNRGDKIWQLYHK